MPEWASVLLTTLLPLLFGGGGGLVAFLYKTHRDSATNEATAQAERKKLLAEANETATRTAVECYERLLETTNDEMARLREQLGRVETELADVRQQLDAERQRSATLARKVQTLEEERGKLLQRIADLEGVRA